MKKLQAGIAGVGFIGAAHIEALRRLGNVDVVAIADATDYDKKAEALNVPNGYENYKTMIANHQLDCIHICTPNNTHYEIAMYAMEQGINVVCEKPMTVTVEEARAMRDFAQKKGLVCAINFHARFYPMVYQMKQMVKSGEVGDVYTIHGGYLQDWLYFDTDYNWRLEPEFSGASRAFADIGSHWIDTVEFVTGNKVTEVFADFSTFHKTRKKPLKPIETYSGMALKPEDYEERPIQTEDFATVLFHFDNGAVGSCNISQVYAGRKNQMIVSVAGSKCAMHWDSENSNSLWIGHRELANEQLEKDPSILADATKGVISYPGGHVEGFPDAFKQNFGQIYRAIAAKNPEGFDFADFAAGVREMTICDKIVQSAKERRWVSLD